MSGERPSAHQRHLQLDVLDRRSVRWEATYDGHACSGTLRRANAGRVYASIAAILQEHEIESVSLTATAHGTEQLRAAIVLAMLMADVSR